MQLGQHDRLKLLDDQGRAEEFLKKTSIGIQRDYVIQLVKREGSAQERHVEWNYPPYI